MSLFSQIRSDSPSYFSRYALNLFRENAYISKYINWPLLEDYYPVGGVRIEDDILVTEDGYENLTTAPKGQAALDIINGKDEEDHEEVVEEKIEKQKGWFWWINYTRTLLIESCMAHVVLCMIDIYPVCVYILLWIYVTLNLQIMWFCFVACRTFRRSQNKV